MKMKKLLFITAITLFCISCTGFFPSQEYELKAMGAEDSGGQLHSTTNVYFDNSANNFEVDIFSTHTRTDKVNTSRIRAYQNNPSAVTPWFPTKDTEEFSFYLTYYLTIPGTSIEIPYEPTASSGAGFAQSVIKFNQTTRIPIHNLRAMMGNATLINDIGIIIQNNFTTAVQLVKSSLVLTPEGSELTLINPNSNGFYREGPAPANASSYIVTLGSNQRPLPSGTLAAGNLYIYEVTSAGTVVLKESYPLTINKF